MDKVIFDYLSEGTRSVEFSRYTLNIWSAFCISTILNSFPLQIFYLHCCWIYIELHCCVDIPNSGRGLPRLPYRTKEWDPAFRKYLKSLDEKKPVILCGDLNVAHLDIGKNQIQVQLKKQDSFPL